VCGGEKFRLHRGAAPHEDQSPLIQKEGVFYGMKRIISLILILASVLPFAACLAEPDGNDPAGWFAQDLFYDEMITVPTGQTFAYYSQKDPLWYNLWFEERRSKRHRLFGWGGCCCTSVAMALRCVLEDDEILLVKDVLKTPVAFCVCSINTYQCQDRHPRYELTTQEEYLKLLPVIMADIACGNNKKDIVSRTETGTGFGYLEAFTGPLGIKWHTTKSWDEAAQAVADGKGVICRAEANSPFTTSGHWLFYAGSDEDNEYFLDPMTRDEYTNDRRKIIKVIYQGLVYTEKAKRNQLDIGLFIIIEKDPDAAV
jgi:hypothetical protein